MTVSAILYVILSISMHKLNYIYIHVLWYKLLYRVNKFFYKIFYKTFSLYYQCWWVKPFWRRLVFHQMGQDLVIKVVMMFQDLREMS